MGGAWRLEGPAKCVKLAEVWPWARKLVTNLLPFSYAIKRLCQLSLGNLLLLLHFYGAVLHDANERTRPTKFLSAHDGCEPLPARDPLLPLAQTQTQTQLLSRRPSAVPCGSPERRSWYVTLPGNFSDCMSCLCHVGCPRRDTQPPLCQGPAVPRSIYRTIPYFILWHCAVLDSTVRNSLPCKERQGVGTIFNAPRPSSWPLGDNSDPAARSWPWPWPQSRPGATVDRPPVADPFAAHSTAIKLGWWRYAR